MTVWAVGNTVETLTGETGYTRHNVTVARLYKDGNKWKRTDSFGRDDHPLVAKVVDLADTWIFEQVQNAREQ